MKFTSLCIKNFKGIDDVTINLERCAGNIYTLIGLNESGKTTILEAISYLTTTKKDDELGLFDSKGFEFLDNPNKLIPIGKMQNFNDDIYVKAEIAFERGDKKKIIDYFNSQFNLDLRISEDKVTIQKQLTFENSELTKGPTTYWIISLEYKNENGEYIELRSSDSKWIDVISFIRDNMIPRILYFPTFLFDFPKKIYLEVSQNAETENSKKINNYYKKIIQDILCSVDASATLDIHITKRLKGTEEQKRQAEAFLSKMSSFISRTFFEQWDKIFRDEKKKDRREIKIVPSNANGIPVLTFKIRENDEEYFISERSLGFRWFFAFLLLTEIRGNRKSDQHILFLLDEPASNLHSSAQELILKSFEKTTKNGNKIIYSTHSQYLINPNWLENAFICRNETMNYDVKDMTSYTDNKAKITVTAYREFANKYPNKTTYFQPVLDVLNYRPCLLSNIPNAVIMEGKTDFYTINYFKEILCKSNDYKEFVIMPGLDGADGLDEIIRFYLGWGRKFIVILDNDKQGLSSQKRYQQTYFLTEKQIFNLGDVDNNFKTIESLIASEDKDTYKIKKKKEINHFFQEKLASKMELKMDASAENFKKLLDFMSSKIKEQ